MADVKSYVLGLIYNKGELDESSALFYYSKTVSMVMNIYIDMQSALEKGYADDEVLLYGDMFTVLINEMFRLADIVFKEKQERNLSFFADLAFANGTELKNGKLIGDLTSVKTLAEYWVNGFPENSATPFQYEVSVYLLSLIEHKEQEEMKLCKMSA